jgi:hypothetical protein
MEAQTGYPRFLHVSRPRVAGAILLMLVAAGAAQAHTFCVPTAAELQPGSTAGNGPFHFTSTAELQVNLSDGWNAGCTSFNDATSAMLDGGGTGGTAALNLSGGGIWQQQAKFFADTPQADAGFGFAVAIDGDWLAVGAPLEAAPVPAGLAAPTIALNVGRVYLYQRTTSGWQWHTTLTGDQAGGEFGSAVALRGGDLIVGQPHANLDVGEVIHYRLQLGAWLSNGTASCCGAPGHHFGASVALFGDANNTFSAAAAPGAGAGHVTVQRKNSVGGWDLEVLQVPAGLINGDTFGWSVAGDGGELIVGAPHKTVAGQSNAGTAYVFFRNPLGDWQLSKQLNYPNPVVGDYSGYRVAISGIWAAIGAPGRTLDNAANDTGAVQTFVYVSPSGWNPWQEFTGLTADTNDEFGAAMALQGEHLLVGARGDDSHGGVPDEGSAYFFDLVNAFPVPVWSENTKFTNALPDDSDFFGWSVALSGSDAVVGAPFDDTDVAPTAVLAGSVTLFRDDVIFVDGFDG